MIHTIAGDYKDSVGMMIAGYYNRYKRIPVSEPFSALGWLKDGQMIGQAVFTGYTGSNIDVHLHAPKCMCRKTIKDVYNYAFIQLKCNRLTAKLEYNNDKLSRLLPRLGFEYECLSEAYYGTPDEPIDALVYKLTKNNALRWLNGKQS